MKTIIIADDVLELFPEFHRGIVIVKDVTVRKSYKPVRRLLRQQVESAAGVADERVREDDATLLDHYRDHQRVSVTGE